MKVIPVVTIVLMILTVRLVYGQAPVVDQKEAFARFILSPSYQKFIERTVNDAEKPPLKAQCATLKLLRANQYDIIDQPVFETTGKGTELRSGSWVSLVKVDRCGQSTTRRLLIRFLPDQTRFEATGLLPGDFLGNLKLETDAYKIVTPGLMAAGQCKDRAQFYVLDVKALRPKSADGWAETWVAPACGRTVAATVSYAPIPGGINVAAEELRVLP